MESGDRPGRAPGRHAIDAYGGGGFRFAGMSHRGSILVLPSGISAWAPRDTGAIDLASLAPALSEDPPIDFLLVGTGPMPFPLPAAIRNAFRDAGIGIDPMATGPAARTYNVLLAENRRIGAALLAVE